MVKLLFIVFCLISPNALADGWSTLDSEREIMYQSVAALDWLQTRNIAHNPNKWHETNPILGIHPSVVKVNRYFAITGIAHYFASDMLPEKYRATFQYVSIGIEMSAVAHNYSLGINVKF